MSGPLDYQISSLPFPSVCWRSQALYIHTRGTKIIITYFYFLAEGSIWAILQLALMVNIIDHSRGNDLGLQAFLFGHVIKAGPPASARSKLIEIRAVAYDFLYFLSFI